MHHSRTTALAVGFAVLALLLMTVAATADNYVALGDSYSSGVGTKSFYESTCRRSEYAYTTAGAAFKDAIPGFVGHAVCSSSEWVNGLSNPVEESFHPNRAGHSSGYEPLVRAVIG